MLLTLKHFKHPVWNVLLVWFSEIEIISISDLWIEKNWNSHENADFVWHEAFNCFRCFCFHPGISWKHPGNLQVSEEQLFGLQVDPDVASLRLLGCVCSDMRVAVLLQAGGPGEVSMETERPAGSHRAAAISTGMTVPSERRRIVRRLTVTSCRVRGSSGGRWSPIGLENGPSLAAVDQIRPPCCVWGRRAPADVLWAFSCPGVFHVLWTDRLSGWSEDGGRCRNGREALITCFNRRTEIYAS